MTKGAVDLKECRNKNYAGNCQCEKCAICGFGKHMGIHGPVLGEKPGSKPYGHEFKPRK